jgi:hypothetical protein
MLSANLKQIGRERPKMMQPHGKKLSPCLSNQLREVDRITPPIPKPRRAQLMMRKEK